MTANQRNRIVVFRVTQEEYNSLKTASAAAGSRNISDYTRSGLLELSHAHSVKETIERRFFELDNKLDALQKLLSKLLSDRRGDSSSGQSSVREDTHEDHYEASN